MNAKNVEIGARREANHSQVGQPARIRDHVWRRFSASFALRISDSGRWGQRVGRMTVFDYVVLVIVGLSVIFSVWRGAIREVFALAAWIAAFFAAQAYAGTLAAYLPDAIPNASLRLLSGFVIVFLTVLVLTAVVAFAISKVVRAVGLGPVDRGIGAIFGLLRGMLVVLILVLLCGLTSAPRHPVWREAMLSPPLEAMAVSVRPWLPEDLSRRISYE